MPGNGASLLWDESAPADTANAGAGAGNIRSLETSLRNGLAVEHNWPTVTGAGFGYHLYGSARAYYGVESTVSSTGTDGRLMVTSDQSRLFHVGSNGTMLLGGASALLAMGLPDYVAGNALPQTHFWAVDFGQETTDGNGNADTTFYSSGYSGIPVVLAQAKASVLSNYALLSIGIPTKTGVGFTVASVGAGTIAGLTVTWMSIGSRLLG